MSKYYAAAEAARSEIELSPAVIIKGAIENCRPLMSLQKVKVGAVTYYVPTPISESRLFSQLLVRRSMKVFYLKLPPRVTILY